jgi:tRNA pseudouridine13 synthase
MEPSFYALPDWNRVLGTPAASGMIRAEIEDFQVEEIPLITLAGEGNHLWLEIEKRNANTDWVAKQLASLAGVPGRDVGYAGMKDRRGVTRQWFSIGLQEAGNDAWNDWEIPDARVLQACLHNRKLKRGTLRGNRFVIVVRKLEGSLDDLEDRLQQVAEQGVPNYFGLQRFGHGGRNVFQGARWLQHGGRLPRNKKSIYISAVRSFLFNGVLSSRAKLGNWNRIVDGEVAMLDGSHSSFFCNVPDAKLEARCAEFDIHPSGPLPGDGSDLVAGTCAEIETAVLQPHKELIERLANARVKAARRSLRMLPAGMEWERDGHDLELKFELPAGGYATCVLRELVTTGLVTISESK